MAFIALPNLAHMLRAGGYQVHYRGKWHLSKPAGATPLWFAQVDEQATTIWARAARSR